MPMRGAHKARVTEAKKVVEESHKHVDSILQKTFERFVFDSKVKLNA